MNKDLNDMLDVLLQIADWAYTLYDNFDVAVLTGIEKIPPGLDEDKNGEVEIWDAYDKLRPGLIKKALADIMASWLAGEDLNEYAFTRAFRFIPDYIEMDHVKGLTPGHTLRKEMYRDDRQQI